MESASGVTWGWTNVDASLRSHRWAPLPESEAAVLEHAYVCSWDRVELVLEGRTYVVDPFLPDFEANLATPLTEQGARGILVARLSASPVDSQQGSLAATHHKKLALSSPAIARAQGHTQANTTQEGNVDADGFRLVCRRNRRGRRTTSSLPTLEGSRRFARTDEKTTKLKLWRALPRVDLGACGDTHVVRQILVDGVDVALQHGGRRRLSPAGIACAVAHFLELSFPVRVVLPRWFALSYGEYPDLFTESPQVLVEALMDDDLLVVLPDPEKPAWRPSTLDFKTDRDMECTIELCKTFNAIFCSNDFNQFLSIMDGAHPRFNDYLYMSARSCLYAFDGDDFYHVLDSLGRDKFIDTLFYRGSCG